VDLFLDALTRPDKRTYRVCDVDELAQALAGGQISARRARAGPAPPTRAPSDLATAMTRAKASSQPSASAASRAHRPGHPVRGTAPGRYLQHSDLDDRALFDPRHIRLPRGGANSLCCSAAATRPWRPAHTPRPGVGQIGSQSRAEEVLSGQAGLPQPLCSTHSQREATVVTTGCSRRARHCRARRGSRRQP
jgi:hypothetical protein